MKVVIITVPMKEPKKVRLKTYPMDGDKSLEYGKDVRCPINGVLAKTLKRGEQVKFIYIMTTSGHSHCEENKEIFIGEIEDINGEIGAVLSYDTVEIEFAATGQTYNKLITDLADKIPENAELFVDYTFGYKPAILSLFCALRFAEEFCGAVIQFIVYGKVEFNEEQGTDNPMLYDSTSLYFLFKLMGTMRTANKETASKLLKDFFSI